MDTSLTPQLPDGFAFGVPPTPDAVYRLHTLLSAPEFGDAQKSLDAARISGESDAIENLSMDDADAEQPILTPHWQHIDMLDHLAHTGELPVTLLSVPAYAYVQDQYRILSCGARFGGGYGAMIVTYNPLTPVELPPASMVASGLRNSGFLAYSLFLPKTFTYTLLPEGELREAVVRGEAEAALLTGQEQLTHQALGLYNVVDLGAWWQETTGLPLPLEVVAVRRDVPEDVQRQIARRIRAAVSTSLANPTASLDAAIPYAHKLDRESTAIYIGMYVTEQSIEMGEEGRRSIETLLQRGAERNLIPAITQLDILDARNA